MLSCKNEVRELFKDKIKQQSQVSDFVEFSSRMSTRLSDMGIWKKGMVLASYRALSTELSLSDFETKHSRLFKVCYTKSGS